MTALAELEIGEISCYQFVGHWSGLG
jgi:hypothetical protein